MEIEISKKSYLQHEKLSEKELFILFENILDTVLKQEKFDNAAEAFYTHRNYAHIKIMILENGLEIPVEVESKIKKVFKIESALLKKESKVKIYLGIFMIIFSIGGYVLFENEFGRTPFFFFITVSLFGLGLFFRGISDFSRLQKSDI